MSFKKISGEVKEEPKQARDNKIVKFENDVNNNRVVESYTVPKIKEPGKGDYNSLKAKYGPLAATDPERGHKTQKDARFSLNPLVRDPLSIEEEEKRVIEERVRSRVTAITEETKTKAHQEGFDAGFKKGRDEALAKFTAEGAEKIAQIESLVAGLEGAKESIFRANEFFLVEMVYRIARMILLRELTTDREYILRLCRELIERVGVKDNIRIRLNPEDFAAISMLKEGLEKTFGHMKNLHVETAATVESGGVMIETEWNAIDATIDTQLEGVRQALLGGVEDEQKADEPAKGSGFDPTASGSEG